MGYEAGSRYNPGEAEAMAELGEVEGEISGLRSGFSVRWNGNSPMTGHNGQNACACSRSSRSREHGA